MGPDKKKQTYEDGSNFTTPDHSRQTSYDHVQTTLTSILPRLVEEYRANQDHRTIDESEERYIDATVHEAPARIHHSRTISDAVLSARYHSNIPEEFRSSGEANTVQYQNNFRTVSIVERPAVDIIREAVREDYYRPYGGNAQQSASVVSQQRIEASGHLNLEQSNIAAQALADIKANAFLHIPIIRENTYESPWSYAKFLERRPHLVRADSDHTQNVEVRSEIDVFAASRLIQARYFSKYLLDLLNISTEQLGETAHLRYLGHLTNERTFNYLLYCGGESQIGHSNNTSTTNHNVYHQTRLTSNLHGGTEGYVQPSITEHQTQGYDFSQHRTTEIQSTIPQRTYESVTTVTREAVQPAVATTSYNINTYGTQNIHHEISGTEHIPIYAPRTIVSENTGADHHFESSTFDRQSHIDYTYQNQVSEIRSPAPERVYETVATVVEETAQPYVPTQVYNHSTTYETQNSRVVQETEHIPITHTYYSTDEVTSRPSIVVEENTTTINHTHIPQLDREVVSSNVSVLREQLQNCESRLYQREVIEASKRSELVHRAEQAESRLLDLQQKLDDCERQRLRDSSLRLESEAQASDLRIRLTECEQSRIQDRFSQSHNYVESYHHQVSEIQSTIPERTYETVATVVEETVQPSVRTTYHDTDSYETVNHYDNYEDHIPIYAYTNVGLESSGSDHRIESSTFDRQSHIDYTYQNQVSEIQSSIPDRIYETVATVVEETVQPYVPTQVYNHSTTYESQHHFSEVEEAEHIPITHTYFATEEVASHPSFVVEENTRTFYDTYTPQLDREVVSSNVTVLREQLQNCEARLQEREVLESSKRRELEERAERDRIRCVQAESLLQETQEKLDSCERRHLENSSVNQTLQEERFLRQQSEAQAADLRIRLSECEQRVIHDRSVQSHNYEEMKQRAEKEHLAGQQNEAYIVELSRKLNDFEYMYKQHQQAELAKRSKVEQEHKHAIELRQQEIISLRDQLSSYEQRVQRETMDLSALKAHEDELARQQHFIEKREKELQLKFEELRLHESSEIARMRSEQELLDREKSQLRLANEELLSAQRKLQDINRRELDAFAAEKSRYETERAHYEETLKHNSSELRKHQEEISLLKRQLEESRQKERVYDEVAGDITPGRKGNVFKETYEKTTVIQRSVKEYPASEEDDYEDIDKFTKTERIYDEPVHTVTHTTTSQARAPSSEGRTNLIDIGLPSFVGGGHITVSKADSHKSEKNIYDDVPSGGSKAGGISSNDVINMSRRNNWGDAEVSSTTTEFAIPHVRSVPSPLNIGTSTIGAGVEITDEHGQKHQAKRIEGLRSTNSPRTPLYYDAYETREYDSNVQDNTVTSREEVVKKQVTVTETVESPGYTIADRPRVSDLKEKFESRSNQSILTPKDIPRNHTPSPTVSSPRIPASPSPSPSTEVPARRPVTRSVESYVSTEVTSYSSSGVLPADRPEPVYDNVAAEEEPIYDTVADHLITEEPITRSWAGNTYTPVEKRDNHRSTMTDLEYSHTNGHIPNNVEKFSVEESGVLREWDPRSLVRDLYSVSYEPRVDSKKTRFVNIEGHVEIPSEETKTVAELEREWKQQYMRTREGRLQVFVSHCAEEAPENDYVLSGCDIDANREERILRIKGGPKKLNIVIRVPTNVFDKWRQSLTSHSASSQTDAYVKPIPRTLPHINKHIVIIELGSCSIRGGVLNQEPSLPQSFFPAIAVKLDDGRLVVGADAYAPEVRHNGEFVCPIQAHNPALERYTLNKDVVIACFKKVVSDLAVDPSRHEVLLSIPQNIPTALIGELATIALNDIGFKGTAISRQAPLILYAYGVETGVVIDIGDRLNIVPIFDGYVVDAAIVSIPYGATQVREALRANLCSNNRGLYSFQSPVEKLILRYVLEQTCYVAENFADEERTNHSEVNVSLKPYDLPTGATDTFNIDGSRFTCTEGFFNPKKWGLESKPLHQLVHDAVSLSPIDSRRNLMKNIFLAGGATLLPGLAARLEQELTAITANTIHTQVHISPWRYNSAFLGAQKLAEKPVFEDMCINKNSLEKFLSDLSIPQN